MCVCIIFLLKFLSSGNSSPTLSESLKYISMGYAYKYFSNYGIAGFTLWGLFCVAIGPDNSFIVTVVYNVILYFYCAVGHSYT